MNTAWLNPFNARLKTKTSLLLFMILLVLVILKKFIFSTMPVVAVDISKIKGQFIRQLAEHRVSDAKIHGTSVRFNQALNQSLHQYSQIHHVVLVKKDSVLGFDKKPIDVTAAVMQMVSDNMKGKGNA